METRLRISIPASKNPHANPPNPPYLVAFNMAARSEEEEQHCEEAGRILRERLEYHPGEFDADKKFPGDTLPHSCVTKVASSDGTTFTVQIVNIFDTAIKFDIAGAEDFDAGPPSWANLCDPVLCESCFIKPGEYRAAMNFPTECPAGAEDVAIIVQKMNEEVRLWDSCDCVFVYREPGERSGC